MRLLLSSGLPLTILKSSFPNQQSRLQRSAEKAYSTASAMTVSVAQEEFPVDPTLHLPRILCLHGGGVSAKIFRMQCRALIPQLANKFRLFFADGPFPSAPGPGVLPVYADQGPFYRWVRWQPDHPEIDNETAVAEIEKSLNVAKEADDELGATGEVVGVLGFSQGARIAASLLLRQQIWDAKLGVPTTDGVAHAAMRYKFGILLAGRGPLVSLDTALVNHPAVIEASKIASAGTFQFPSDDEEVLAKGEHIIRTPTFHLHGLKDPGLQHHKLLLEQYFDKETAAVMEWDGPHRVPIKPADIEALVKQILALAERAGV